MLHRRRSNASSILEFYLEKEAVDLRKQAEGMPLRVRPETSGRIAEFSEHEAD